MSSKIPSKIDNHLKDLKYHSLIPIGISNKVYPTFTLREDKILPYNIQFSPNPICSCSSYKKSVEDENLPLCYHIIYILIQYYKISPLSLRMYHKLPENYYESLVTYIDNWVNTQFNSSQLRKRRKKPNYNFLRETDNLYETTANKVVLNPMYEYYTKHECAICLESLCSKDIMMCPECYNYSHVKCMYKWLVMKQGCHFCRDNPTKTKIDEGEEFPDLILSAKTINRI